MTHMTITLDVPRTVQFATKAGDSYTVDFDKVPLADLPGLLVDGLIAGFMKAGVDAGAGAKEYGAKNEMDIETARDILIQKRIKVWESGTWTSRAMGG